MTDAPTLRVVEAGLFERPVAMRLPFRFGAATVTRARQAFLRLRVEDGAGRQAEGYAAELMVPKWFDKNPELSNEDNEAQLRRSLQIAAGLALEAAPASAFGLHAALEPAHHRAAGAEGLNGLIASFGLALVDRAILDALCRLDDLPVTDAIRANRPGIDASTTRDLAGFDLPAFLAGLRPQPSLHLRHTVGYADALRPEEVGTRLGDGLPESLTEEIEALGISHFKIKLSGRPEADVERLKAVAGVLDRFDRYRATLDGNEQFDDEAHVLDLWDRIEAEPALKRLRSSILFVEQPINRAKALSEPVARLAVRVPVEIDESDGTPNAFLEARACGYTGISSKSCKGFYRAVLNAARVAQWNAQAGSECFFMSAEDLTTQAGIAVQQDLALASLLSLGHVERNGHHYVDGMAGADGREAGAFLAAHSDLYRPNGANLRLRVEGGRLALGSVLASTGLGVAQTAAEAAFAALSEKDIAA